MANKARHAFGNSADVEAALSAGKIDAYDILFLDGDVDPKVGWIDAKGEFRLVKNETDFSEIEAEVSKKADIKDVEALEGQIATKADSTEVEAKISAASQDTVASAKAYTDGKIEAAISEHMVKKYEITSVPKGTLVDYREGEIRIMCPADTQWVKQNVGETGDANTYYATFKTYVFDDNVVGYKERMGNQVDKEILTTFSVDGYGRRYQTTWLGLAKYDESADVWTYYGKNSTENKYIGWDYQIDWYDADGMVVASDCVRINLSNENCHSVIKPYYVGSIMTEIDAKIVEKIEEKITEVESVYEIIEF
jgi:hypothetical protein